MRHFQAGVEAMNEFATLYGWTVQVLGCSISRTAAPLTMVEYTRESETLTVEFVGNLVRSVSDSSLANPISGIRARGALEGLLSA